MRLLLDCSSVSQICYHLELISVSYTCSSPESLPSPLQGGRSVQPLVNTWTNAASSPLWSSLKMPVHSPTTNPGLFLLSSAVPVTSRVSSLQWVSAFTRLVLRLLPSLICDIQPLNTEHMQFSYCFQTGLPKPATLWGLPFRCEGEGKDGFR